MYCLRCTFWSVKLGPFDIIFMDPPYHHLLEKSVLEYLENSVLADQYTIIVVEASLETDFSYLEGSRLHIYKEKRYKTNKHIFIEKIQEDEE